MARNKNSLSHQLHMRMQEMRRYGESKYDAKKEYRAAQELSGEKWNPAKADGIFSFKTYEAYKQTSKEFTIWLKENHPDVKNINQVERDHIGEYLKHRDTYTSPFTVSKDMAALNKIFNAGIKKSDYDLSRRSYKDITRSREPATNDKHVNLNNYKDQVTVAQGTGIRRQSMLTIKPENFNRGADGKVESVDLKEKGGRERTATILLEYRDRITEIVDAAEVGKPLFDTYPKAIDNHFFRAEYAFNRYQELAEGKDLQEDYRGYDSECLLAVSRDLGHNRLSVVVEHYMKGRK